MKDIVLLKRIFHRGMYRIAICFSYERELMKVVKSLPGVHYSGTYRCFYLDESEENLTLIISSLSELAELNTDVFNSQIGKISESHTLADRTKDHVATKIYAPAIPESGSVLIRVNEESGSVIVVLPIPFDHDWVDELKSYRGSRYDGVRKEWSLPWSKVTCDSIADYFSRAGVNVVVRKGAVDATLKLERMLIGAEVRHRPICNKALDGLDRMSMYMQENRYSPRSRETYLAMMDFFFRYFSEKDPQAITGTEVSKFIYDYIIRLGYSAAYQNQMISAVKTYYSISGNINFQLNVPGRPRRARALPKIFSKEEVGRILNSAGNTKHKLLLWIIYSCGLRRSEVTNLKLKDLDRSRSILHIREGKGMVDRVVPVSDKVWLKIDEYLVSYKPKQYLFEGQTGRRYSAESVYRVFKNALQKAGIMKDVGVHSLRHSYATHLHENGLDIKYIQELLGHKSTKTTEIYTHVSRRNLIAVRSPIEDLDVK